MIAIVNYGSGNIQAIANIYNRLGVPHTIAARPADLDQADHVILPGVGAFDQAMGDLEGSGMRQALDRWALAQKRPVLGICVGMQLLAQRSDEGQAGGLGWLDAQVERFDASRFGPGVRLPHLGWNSVESVRPDPLFEGIDGDQGFYFLHSYFVHCHDAEDVAAITRYGAPFTCGVRRQNICGVQFHPEKSHQNGVRLLANFAGL